MSDPDEYARAVIRKALEETGVTGDRDLDAAVDLTYRMLSGWGPIRLVCGRCGATALPDGSTRDGLPRGWERFIIRGERRYACPVCVDQAGLLAASPW